jgi:hypothetical protein
MVVVGSQQLPLSRKGEAIEYTYGCGYSRSATIRGVTVDIFVLMFFGAFSVAKN